MIIQKTQEQFSDVHHGKVHRSSALAVLLIDKPNIRLQEPQANVQVLVFQRFVKKAVSIMFCLFDCYGNRVLFQDCLHFLHSALLDASEKD